MTMKAPTALLRGTEWQAASQHHQKRTEMTSKVFDKFITSVTEIGWVWCDCRQTARSLFCRLAAD